MPRGRPPIKITDETIEKAFKLASRGLNMEQIASCLGMSSTVLYERQITNPDLKEAIEKGRHHGIEEISNALYEKAKSGDNTAMIFFLKNRSPQEWNDRREHVHKGDAKNPVEMTINYVAEDDDEDEKTIEATSVKVIEHKDEGDE